MKTEKESMLLYAVTDRKWVGKQTLYEQVESALKGGVTCVQLREKELPHDDFLREAVEINKLCKEYKVPFIVNDNVDIAVECGADGVHVGQSDMGVAQTRKRIGDDMILGVSTQTVEQAKKAEAEGADYLGVGAIFQTKTKRDAESVSYQTLKQICGSVSVPVVAIGGIKKGNMRQLKGSGADGVAVISAVFAAEDIQKEFAELKNISKETFSL